uniref:Uncharacterized protein n=1 Tax=Aegilops tauschii TaxID=37682 RepID=M8BQJ4_AEGTA
MADGYPVERSASFIPFPLLANEGRRSAQQKARTVAATTKKTPNSRIPKYPSLPSQLLCQVQTSPCMYVHTVHLQVQADKDADEVYAHMTLQPVNSVRLSHLIRRSCQFQETDVFPIPCLGSYAKSKASS